jgi:hypothetical protein
VVLLLQLYQHQLDRALDIGKVVIHITGKHKNDCFQQQQAFPGATPVGPAPEFDFFQGVSPSPFLSETGRKDLL